MARTNRRTSIVVALALAAGLIALPQTSTAQTPSYFPDGHSLGTTAYTLRLAGGTRAQTAGVLARVAAINQSRETGYPFAFNEPDPNDRSLAYGFDACPNAFVVVAQDNPSDALAASALKDLRATIDGSTIDTGSAILLLTASGRQGATALSGAARSAIEAVKAACTDPIDGLVLGGTAAVSAGAFNELNTLLRNVVRVAGSNRFDTARRISEITSSVAGLPNVRFHASASPNDSSTLLNSVLLAEGFTGADALAVGPFAASENAPVLLTETDTLPAPTAQALGNLGPSNIIVLGGTAAISDEVAQAAATAAGGATITRISGANRYETSIRIAERLYRYYTSLATSGFPPTDSERYANLAIGFARSEGAGANHAGWPDALASAFFLNTYDTLKVPTPERLAPNIERSDLERSIGGVDSTHATPLLLVAQASVPSAVVSYLDGLWPNTGDMTTAAGNSGDNHGGFGFVFGGTAAISSATEVAIAHELSGRSYVEANRTDLAPAITGARTFFTELNYGGFSSEDNGGVHNGSATAAGNKVCTFRNALTGSQWLALYRADGSLIDANTVRYQQTQTGWTAMQSRFTCTAAPDVTSARARGVSLSGNDTPQITLNWSSSANRLDGQGGPGAAVSNDPANCHPHQANNPDGGSRTCTITYTGDMDGALQFRGTPFSNATYVLTIQYTRTSGTAFPPDFEGPTRITYVGTLRVSTQAGSLLFSAGLVGEAVDTGAPLKLAGMYTIIGQRGGFTATVSGDDADTVDSFAINGLA